MFVSPIRLILTIRFNLQFERMSLLLISGLRSIHLETRNATLKESCKEALDYLLSDATMVYGTGR